MTDPLPLSIYTVLDLTILRAGPTAVRTLADWGARVIRIDAMPEARRTTGTLQPSDEQNLHRNKRSLRIDLKHARGATLFRELVGKADVVVENFRPRVKTALGLDYERLKLVNPRIIVASISGFGQDGPYRDRPAVDQVIQGMSGLMSVTGLPGQGPVRTGAAIADIAAGLYAALGIMTALIERQSSGRGQWVQSSLLQAGIALLDFQAARYLMKHEVAPQVGNDHPTSMPTSAYPTADGHLNVAASGEGMWQRLCKELGREDLLGDADFSSNEKRAKNRARLNAELGASFRRKTSAEWVEALNRAGVPCGPIYRIDQVFADPQVQHLGVAANVEHARLGRFDVLSQAVRLSRTPAAVASATPEIGQHTDEILSELEYRPEDIARLRSLGAV